MRHNYRRTVRSLWTWLWGRYHVPQNVFLVLYNIIHSNVDVDLAMFDKIYSDLVRSRGHPLQIVKSHCRINARLYSFVPRIINMYLSPWTPCEVLHSPNSVSRQPGGHGINDGGGASAIKAHTSATLLSKSVFQNTYFTFFSYLKKTWLFTFFQMTYQKVVKSH